jgi:hypothetical protein
VVLVLADAVPYSVIRAGEAAVTYSSTERMSRALHRCPGKLLGPGRFVSYQLVKRGRGTGQLFSECLSAFDGSKKTAKYIGIVTPTSTLFLSLRSRAAESSGGVRATSRFMRFI